jgi:hypothetical protein
LRNLAKSVIANSGIPNQDLQSSNQEMQIKNCKSRIANQELQIKNCKLGIANQELQIRNQEHHIKSCKYIIFVK